VPLVWAFNRAVTDFDVNLEDLRVWPRPKFIGTAVVGIAAVGTEAVGIAVAPSQTDRASASAVHFRIGFIGIWRLLGPYIHLYPIGTMKIGCPLRDNYVDNERRLYSGMLLRVMESY